MSLLSTGRRVMALPYPPVFSLVKAANDWRVDPGAEPAVGHCSNDVNEGKQRHFSGADSESPRSTPPDLRKKYPFQIRSCHPQRVCPLTRSWVRPSCSWSGPSPCTAGLLCLETQVPLTLAHSRLHLIPVSNEFKIYVESQRDAA